MGATTTSGHRSRAHPGVLGRWQLHQFPCRLAGHDGVLDRQHLDVGGRRAPTGPSPTGGG